MYFPLKNVLINHTNNIHSPIHVESSHLGISFHSTPKAISISSFENVNCSNHDSNIIFVRADVNSKLVLNIFDYQRKN